jgi:hypothetical protein
MFPADWLHRPSQLCPPSLELYRLYSPVVLHVFYYSVNCMHFLSNYLVLSMPSSGKLHESSIVNTMLSYSECNALLFG